MSRLQGHSKSVMSSRRKVGGPLGAPRDPCGMPVSRMIINGPSDWQAEEQPPAGIQVLRPLTEMVQEFAVESLPAFPAHEVYIPAESMQSL